MVPVQRPHQCGELPAIQSREIVKDPFNHAGMSHIGAVVLRVLDRALKKRNLGKRGRHPTNIVLSRLR
jgi:hypothetical protein